MVDNDNIGKTVFRNSIFTILYNSWYLGSRIVLIPIILSFISVDEYGLWSYCFVILSYLALTAFGFNNTYIKYMAEYRAKGENEKVNELISTGLISMAFVSVILFLIFWGMIPSLLELFKIEDSLKTVAYGLLIGTAAMFVLNCTLSCYQSLLEGEQKIALVKKIHLLASVVEIILILIFFYFKLGVYSLLIAYIVRYLLIIALSIYFAYQLFPFLKVSVSVFRKHELKKFMGYGNQMSLLGLMSFLIQTVDRLFITRYISLEATGFYEIGRKLPNVGLMLPASVIGTLMPAASHLKGSDQNERLVEMYLSASRYLMMLATLPYMFLIFFATPLIEVWVGRGFEQSIWVMRFLAMGTFINLFTGMGTSFMRGMGTPRYEIQYMSLSLGILLCLLPFGIHFLGIMGAAFSYFLAQSIGSIYFIIIVNRNFGVPFSIFGKRVILPSIIMSVTGLPLFLFYQLIWNFFSINRFIGLSLLLMIGIGYVVSTLFIFYQFKQMLILKDEQEQMAAYKVPRFMEHVWHRFWG